MNRESCLDEAKKCVCCDRESQYGSPENNFKRIASLWTNYLDVEVNGQDVANMMILLKISRAKSGNFKNDNYVDIAGYAACACEMGDKE